MESEPTGARKPGLILERENQLGDIIVALRQDWDRLKELIEPCLRPRIEVPANEPKLAEKPSQSDFASRFDGFIRSLEIIRDDIKDTTNRLEL